MFDSSLSAASSGHALQRAHLDVRIAGLSAVFDLQYRFVNGEAEPIEALFTFPIPREAAFIGLEAELGGERLAARVVAADDAEREYDDAIADGHSAMLLEQIEPGLLCASLGNLAPGEAASFSLRYVLPLVVIERCLRLRLPLAIRPRYGHWMLEDLAEPVTDPAASYVLEADIHVAGLLADARVSCPTHPIRFHHDASGLHASLCRGWLDGDLVLVFEQDQAPAARVECFADGQAQALRIDLPVPLPPAVENQPLQMALVLDCSGSMVGDAIDGARLALRGVAAALGEDDRIQVLRFGNEVHPLLRRPMKASAAVRVALAGLADLVEADLGGTEMGHALLRALDDLERSRDQDCAKAVFLVTDGAVQPQELAQASARAARRGVRVFVVAVGSSASVDTLTPLAEETGGQLEHVVPGEAMAEAVLRQLRRIRQGASLPLRIDFGQAPSFLAQPCTVYGGDAVCVQARLEGVPETVRLWLGGSDAPQVLAVERVEATPDRLALLGLARYRAAAAEQRADIALQYGLLSPETSAIVVRERADAERIDVLPQVRVQPQMLGRGTAGFDVPGLDLRPAACMSAPAFLRRSFVSDIESDYEPVTEPMPPRPVAPDPAEVQTVLRAMAGLLRQALAAGTPDLKTLANALGDGERMVLCWLMSPTETEALPELLPHHWLDFVDALTGPGGQVRLDPDADDRLAEALLMAGHGGLSESSREALLSNFRRLSSDAWQ